jgi:hypothetical protein
MKKKELINCYVNGNVLNFIYSDGTRIREWKEGETPTPDYPSSIDLKITNFCDLSNYCKWCLVPNTKISTPKGFVDIENIKKGQIVYSYDEKNKQIVEDLVQELFVREIEEEIYVIEIESGKILEITGNHEVFVFEKGWILASNLEEGDEVMDFIVNIEKYKIKKITKKHYKGKVYNFGTKIHHNYFANDILVHNCHENSDKSGKHSNLEQYYFLLEQLPSGVELAIGGGNALEHPNLIPFLQKAKENGIICNMTINELHLKKFKKEITHLIKESLIKGVGITYSGRFKEELKYFSELTDNLVFHVIMGVHDLSCLEDIQNYSNKVLILGYKQFRKGAKFHSKEVEDKKYQWYIRLPLYFKKMILSFDNLAIEQVNLKRWLTDGQWEQFYQGREGTHSLYIDAVENKYATSSTHEKRGDVNGNIKLMFSNVKAGKLS